MKGIYLLGTDKLPSTVRIGEGEKVRTTLVALPGVAADVNLEVVLDGEGAELDIAGLYVCSGSDRLNLNVNVRHDRGGGISRQLFRGIAGGGSAVEFNGLVYVAPDAQKTKASQESRALLLSRGARVQAKPQLEIYADDVECSHGATVGFPDEEELFYMRSRGIPEEEARRLQMVSFLAPVLERLPQEFADRITEEL
ncbi:MAG: SufD family Fe-S cluster assembly protein [Bacteroidales bacterium]|nr:SufD family Fe-S cluster assembly protein [Bacteroidales bacterium]